MSPQVHDIPQPNEDSGESPGIGSSPFPPNAMPLPRLGCGGPSHVKDESNSGDCPHGHHQVLSKVNPGDDKMPHHPRVDLKDGDKPTEPKNSALPSLPPHAMPLPRLGCGGPCRSSDEPIWKGT